MIKEELKMPLSKEQEDLYRKTMDEAKRQLDGIDSQVEKELQKVREKLADLQQAKKSFKMIYEGTAKLLGIETEADEEEEADATQAMGKM